MSWFTEWSDKSGVPTWVFFVASAVGVVLLVKMLLM